MSSVKWIKMKTDLFENRKIKYIRKMPKGEKTILIWFQLLCTAGKVNDSGRLTLTDDIPYNAQFLATELEWPLDLVQQALSVFLELEMIEKDESVYRISNWEKYQSQDRLSEIREYNRKKKRESRARQNEKVSEMSMTSQACQSTDIDLDLEVDLEVEKEKENENDKEKDKTVSVSNLQKSSTSQVH